MKIFNIVVGLILLTYTAVAQVIPSGVPNIPSNIKAKLNKAVDVKNIPHPDLIFRLPVKIKNADIAKTKINKHFARSGEKISRIQITIWGANFNSVKVTLPFQDANRIINFPIKLREPLRKGVSHVASVYVNFSFNDGRNIPITASLKDYMEHFISMPMITMF
jgi:DNA-binding protein